MGEWGPNVRFVDAGERPKFGVHTLTDKERQKARGCRCEHWCHEQKLCGNESAYELRMDTKLVPMCSQCMMTC